LLEKALAPESPEYDASFSAGLAETNPTWLYDLGREVAESDNRQASRPPDYRV
jgi:hypothetical protein